MWKCGECGCLEIAPSLDVCPACRAPRKEEQVPRANHSGGSNGLELREETSAGYSSLTSESSPDKSGETSTTGHPSPAPSAENRSGAEQHKTQTRSDASSTAGSTHATTHGRPSPQNSSAARTEDKSKRK